MSNFSRKAVAVGLALTTAAWLAGAVLPASAQTSAATIATLMAQIQALQAQLVALQGGSASVSSAYNYTRDLTVGSTGADVTALQQMLVSGGYMTMPQGVAYGYFGTLTKNALAKYQAAKGITPAVGYFGPKTRAYVASTSGTPTTGGAGGVVVPSGSGLSVSLASDNPVAMSISRNADTTHFEIVPVLRANFTAGASAVTVTGLNVNRSGLSSDQDLTNAYLMIGNKIVATNIGMNNGVIQYSNAAGLFTVNAGQTLDVTVAVSIGSTVNTGSTYQFSIASASAITAGATVSGVFPVSGATLTLANPSNLGYATITNGSAGTTSANALSINAGQKQFNVGQFTIQASNQAVSVKSLTFTETGSVGVNDVSNFQLYNGSTLIGTVASLNGNTATFDLSASPLQLTSGQSAQLYLYADITGGVNRYFQMSIQHNYDVVASDMMFNMGILPAMNTGNFPMNMSYVNVNSGTLTVTKDAASPSNYVLPGGTNQTIAKFDFAANGEAVKLTQISVVLNTSSSITNLKLVDDQGVQIGTTQSTLSSLTTAYTNLNYLIPANTTRVLSVIADVGSAFTGNLNATVNAMSAQGYTSLATITPSNSTGNTLTATTNLLTAGLNSAVGTTNIVSGQTNVKVNSFTLTAGAGSAVTVSNVTLKTNTNVASNYQNLVVKVGSTQWGNTQNTLTDSTSYTFTAPSIVTIPSGGQIVVDVYADAKTGLSTTSTQIVNLTNASANSVATNQPISTVGGTPVTGQTDAIVAAGTLAYNPASMPSGAQVGMGTQGVVLASYQITGSNNEAITAQNIYLSATSSMTGLFNNYRLVDANSQTQYGSSLNLTGTSSPYTVEFVGVNIPITVGGTKTINIVADANTYSALSASYTSSTTPTSSVLMSQIDYQGTASQQTASTTSTAYGNTFTVYRNTLSAATASGAPLTSSIGNGVVVGGITFKAGSNTTDPVYLNSLSIKQVYSGATTTATLVKFYVYDAQNGNQVVASGTANVVGSGSTSTLVLNLGGAATGGLNGGNGMLIGAGSSHTYYIAADLSSSGFADAVSNVKMNYQVQLTGFNWTDGTQASSSIAADPAFGYSSVPLNASASALQL